MGFGCPGSRCVGVMLRGFLGLRRCSYQVTPLPGSGVPSRDQVDRSWERHQRQFSRESDPAPTGNPIRACADRWGNPPGGVLSQV